MIETEFNGKLLWHYYPSSPIVLHCWYKIHFKMLDFRAWITSSLFNTYIYITLNFLSVKGQFKFCLYPKAFPFLIFNGMHSFYYTIAILRAYCHVGGWGELSNYFSKLVMYSQIDYDNSLNLRNMSNFISKFNNIHHLGSW